MYRDHAKKENGSYYLEVWGLGLKVSGVVGPFLEPKSGKGAQLAVAW